MNNNSHYWTNKDARAQKAKDHTSEMDNKYSAEIQNSIANTTVHSTLEVKPSNRSVMKTNDSTNKTFVEPTVELIATDSVKAVLDSTGRTCVLNFASYKHPGGMFLNGSKAQEECLCHESFLYNVLRNFENYYGYNKSNLNKALYTDRALYSPDITFERDGNIKVADVLTCASPNYTAAEKYCHVSKEENSKILRQRIKFILSILNHKKPDTIILGAFGCGVFGQNPTEVATIFKEEIKTAFTYPTKVVFAVIDENSPNYKAFESIFSV